jgi:nucleoside-diphosphate-sugar epimerase
MSATKTNSFIVRPDDLILVTGATGFIGRRVVKALLDRGFRNLRCLTRSSSHRDGLEAVLTAHKGAARVEITTGNLLSRDDCAVAAKGAAVVLHLAAGRGEKSFPDAFVNSVVTTRNLLEACAAERSLLRFVNMSSFAVYRNSGNPKWRLLDESAPVEDHPEQRGNAYCFAKAEQDKLVTECCRRFGIPFVIIRPGWVYGPGNPGIHGRVGVGTFGVFLHLGGGNTMPLTYVDNCAEAVVLAGLTNGVEGEVFNVVDDDLPSSRRFLRMYKRNVRRFKSIYLPHAMTYYLCCLWEWYSKWSKGQLPPVYNRKAWHASWKRTRYSNAKLKSRVGWQPSVPMSQGLRLHFEGCRMGGSNA